MKLQRGSPKRRSKTPPDFFSHDVTKARRFYLDLDPPTDVTLTVTCGGLEHCTPAYAIHRSTFPFYTIEYVARGRGDLELKGRRYALQPGRLFSYGPGIAHHITGHADEPLVKYFVDFVGTEALQLLRSCYLLPGSVSKVFPPHALQSILDELIDSGQRLGQGNATLCVKLLECLALKIRSARAPLEGAETLAFNTYQQTRQYIAEHFPRLRTLQQISLECHITSAHLCRLFGRYDHQSPYQYLLRLKMNAAAERLAQPGTLVKQVAEQTGFADPFHFSRVFKRVFGLSPDGFHRLRPSPPPRCAERLAPTRMPKRRAS
jgi:AraC-like DNA-binding protein